MSTKYLSKIYTDGSCLQNPNGPGGYAFALIINDEVEAIGFGSEPNTTNNRMELQAVISALNFVEGTEYIIYTDSKLTINCAQGIWKRKANLDLWKEYECALRGRKIYWNWVRGHSGDKYNELVDELAREEAKTIKNKNLVI